ncbi:MAG: hypothetical protein ACYCPW_09390 [Nitrososphaerales archaeon]
MSPLQFIAKTIFTFEGHVIGEISQPRQNEISFGEIWYQLFFNRLLPDALVTNKCFVCEKDYRLFDRKSRTEQRYADR